MVRSRITPVDDTSAKVAFTMTYRLKPAFLANFAEGGIKAGFDDFLIGMEHFMATGEEVTAERFESIAGTYR
ncbi:MAG: hypothetical protein AAGA48_32030 [Myxococcota bacterium]